MKSLLLQLAHCKNNPEEAIQLIETHGEHLPLFDHPSFFGVLSEKEICEQRWQLDESQLFLCLAYKKRYTIMEICRNYQSTLLDTNSLGFYRDNVFFHREKGLVFANHVKRMATPAIECWLMIARRVWIVRDIRQLIATLLWKDRHLWFNEQFSERKLIP
jgi:hypothetical protein